MRLSVRWPDRIITTGLILLIVCSTFAFGGVHRWAFIVLETLCLSLPLVWLTKVWQEAPARPRIAVGPAALLRLAAPVVALTGLIVAQLVPMPPRGLRIVAPSNYRLYQMSLPGWPWFAPYQSLAPMTTNRGTTDTAAGQLTSNRVRPVRAEPLPSGWSKLYWRTLSLSPTVTASSLVEWLALVAVFLVVLSYPVGLVGERDAEALFHRSILLGLMAVAISIAVIGLFERAWWNGKLLWFYVPRDWGGPLFPNPPRASGPFVDPDHFANYLATVLPLTVVFTLFPPDFVRMEWRSNVQFVAGLGCTIMAPAILLSLSRAGWIASVAGVGIAFVLCLRGHSMATSTVSQRLVKRSGYYAMAGLVALIGGLIFFAGPIGQNEIANRLGTTLGGFGAGVYRPLVWRDTLKMIADFPIFGVGLGCWPELFPHYQRPPWIPFFFREAENDYIQFIAETGLIGAATLLWLGFTIVRDLRQGASILSDRQWPLFAGLIGSGTAFLVHEFFDFSFRTPANALLFTILLAVALRIALTAESRRSVELRLATRKATHLAAWMIFSATLCVGLIVGVWLQDGKAYPYGVYKANDSATAVGNIARHPAMGIAHLALVEKARPDTPAVLRSLLLRSAVWLDPNNPAARDLYAQDFLRSGNQGEGLQQITRSIFHAPSLDAHYYLEPRSIPWLLPAEQKAIQAGFASAIDAEFDGAVEALTGFYERLGRYQDIAELNVRIAKDETDDAVRLDRLIEAGRNYALAGKYDKAETVLRKAAQIDPADARPYAELMRSVYGPTRRLDQARSIVATAMNNGADSYDLNIGLADGAEAAGDRNALTAALEDALRYRSSFDTAIRLGTIYLKDKLYARAATTFGRAAELRPSSAEAWFDLGQSYEGDYDYASASKAYHRARMLAPENHYYDRVYTEFEQRTAASPQ